jgi:phage gp36-like protein
MSFITPQDYSVLIRNEIANELDLTTEQSAFKTAEGMAVSQMKNHLSGRYDIAAIFADAPAAGEPDTRDPYIVMLCIDITLYHIWAKEGGNRIPKTREARYEDAVKWLTAVQKGAPANLPPLKDEAGKPYGDIRIRSKHIPESNRY